MKRIGKCCPRLHLTHFFPPLIPLLCLGSSLLFQAQGMLAKSSTDFPEAERAPPCTTLRPLDRQMLQEGDGGPSSLGKD